MYRVLSAEPPPINRADLPPAVLAPVLRAMAKQPEARYGSARELARHLQAVQAELGLPVTDLIGSDATPPRPAHPTTTGPAFPATGHHAPPTTGHHAPPTTGHHSMGGSVSGPAGGNAFPATGRHLPRPSPP
ncbi:hypothetical protein [Nonomuraea salmonea]|uniref:hypothetical protein n=1 Tax=Nonomuraea salmonea TaxID=46181 RepID=UPI002FED03F5